MSRARTAVLPLVLGAALTAAPAAGDWLVLRDGTRIETAGPWEVQGSQVVFTPPGGRLSALRAADVDLEASAAATRAAAAEPAPGAGAGASRSDAARPKKAARVFTDETVAPRSAVGEDGGDAETVEAGLDTAGDAEAGAAEAGDAQAGGEPVQVVAWSRRDSADDAGLEVVGTLRNTGEAFAADIRVKVTVHDPEGQTLFDTRAFLGASALAPGATTRFRARLPGIHFFAGEPSFEVSSDAFSVGAPPPPEEEAGAEEGGEQGR